MGNIRVRIEIADTGLAAALSAFLDADPRLEVTRGDADVVVVGFDEASDARVVAVHSPGTGVLAIGQEHPEPMIAALEAGALGYMSATASFDQIADGVHSVGGGHGVVPPAMLGGLLRHVVHRRRAARADLDRLETLTSRERDVLELVASGLDRAAIAQRLFISTDTVRTHLMRMFRKLDVHSQPEAVAFAARCGLAAEPEGER
ncbi:MAG TPA: response regulator transcription factor [Acidimicrobiia bacterium]|nr:response regulator transcription factor [Acidimicrobiia bacterium]